jgi:hypothetical protein
MKAMLPWLWLNEAASSVAERLMNEQQPLGDIVPASRLDKAREELLAWAYHGQLVVEGRPWSIPGPEEPDCPDREGWKVINASMWDPCRLRKAIEHRALRTLPSTADPDQTAQVLSIAAIFEASAAPSPDTSEDSQPSDTYIVLNWEQNTLTIDGLEIFEPYGYSDLRVRRADLEEILPPAHSSIGRTVASGTQTELINSPSPRNSGGAPRKFADDLLIEIIRIANGIDGLPEHKQDLIRQLREFHLSSWGDDLPSESTIQRIVDMVYKRIFSKT